MLSQRLRIKSKLHEDVHFCRFLANDKLAIVGRRQFIKSEEAQVGEDLIQSCIVTVCIAKVLLEKYFRKNLNKATNLSLALGNFTQLLIAD